MILDIEVRMFEGEMCLCKYAPTIKTPLDIENGFVNISIKSYTWQKIISIEKLNPLLNNNISKTEQEFNKLSERLRERVQKDLISKMLKVEERGDN